MEVNKECFLSNKKNNVLTESEIQFKNNFMNKFNLFIKKLVSDMGKCKYRKVLDDINIYENLFFSSSNEMTELSQLKIRCMLKIVNKKILKYENILFKNNNYFRSIDNWFLKIDLELENLEELLNIRDDKQIDVIMQFKLEEIYLLALLAKFEDKFLDCAAFLATGERLIKVFIQYTRSTKTLLIIQKIYLFLSSLLISDREYIKAMNYQSLCIEICLRELLIFNQFTDEISYESLSKCNKHNLNKIFSNITIALYQRGSCEEIQGYIENATECYQQAKWFSTKLIKDENPELVQFIIDVEKRSMMYLDLLKNLKTKCYNLKNEKFRLLKNQIKSNLNLDKLTSIAEGRYVNMKIFDNTVDKINKLNFHEYDYESNLKNENFKLKDYLLSTIYLTNNLLNEKFKDIIMDAKDLRVNRMDEETRHKFQKRINDLRVEKILIEKRINLKNVEEKNDNISDQTNELMNRKCVIHDSNSSSMGNFSFTNNIKYNKRTIRNCRSNSASTLFSNKSNYSMKKRINSASTLFTNKSNLRSDNLGNHFMSRDLNFYQNLIKNKESQKTTAFSATYRPYCSYIPGQVQKLKHDKYILSSSYKNKINYIKKFNDREITFQKKILNLKKKGIVITEAIDLRKAKLEAKEYFKRELNFMKQSKQSNSDSKNNQKNEKKNLNKERTENILKNLVIKSLSTTSSKNLKSFVNKEDGENLIGEFTNKNEEKNCRLFIDKKSLNKRNNDFVNKINIELENINKDNSFYENVRYSIKYEKSIKSEKKSAFLSTSKNNDSFIKLKNI